MRTAARNTGISVVGDLPWGTHFCLFYETIEDLLDILVPYFKAGLEREEFCLWIAPESLTKDEALGAMGRVLPDLDRYLAAGSIELAAYNEWYLEGDTFAPNRVIERFRVPDRGSGNPTPLGGWDRYASSVKWSDGSVQAWQPYGLGLQISLGVGDQKNQKPPEPDDNFKVT